MTDYISRDDGKIAALRVISCFAEREVGIFNPIVKTLDEIFDDIPAADVREVVLCRECIHSERWYGDRRLCFLWNDEGGNSVFDDGFCNYGERAECPNCGADMRPEPPKHGTGGLSDV